MEEFKYADDHANDREIMIAVASMVIGVGVLSLPRSIADTTKFADGWITILIGGIIAVFFTWLTATLASKFPKQSFVNYATTIISKPLAITLTMIFSLLYIGVTAFQIRKFTDISKEYLLVQTPMEVIVLVFFLIIIYAVSGASVDLLRLNILFLPFIIFISIVLVILNISLFDIDNLLPVFKTSFREYTQGVYGNIVSYTGASILLFYIALVKDPKKTAQKAVIGMIIPIGLYLLIFIASIGIFGYSVTKNLVYPTIELAKVTDVPGGFFERFDSIFFVIWTMAIFNTTAMAFDIAVISMNSIFKKVKKINFIFILAPIIYFITILPQDLMQVNDFGAYVSRTVFIYTIFIVTALLIIAKLKGVKQENE